MCIRDSCYLVADNNPDTSTADRLLSIDPITGDFVDIGATLTNNMEGATWNLTGTTLYGVEAGQLVTIDKDTGVRTVVGTIGAINGTFGSIATPHVDRLAFDPAHGKLYAVARREDNPITAGNTLLDVLFQINPTTGARVANAYGAGVDYIPIATNTLTPALYDVDDIVFDRSGVLYAIANDSTANIGLSDRLVTLNKATGAITDIAGFIDAADGTTAVTDVEDLAFLVGFGLLASTGDASTNSAQRPNVRRGGDATAAPRSKHTARGAGLIDRGGGPGGRGCGMRPRAWRSVGGSAFSPRPCSGDMYGGLPAMEPSIVTRERNSCRATPKSMRTARRTFWKTFGPMRTAPGTRKMLSGVRSR